jgi:hypothetical protein
VRLFWLSWLNPPGRKVKGRVVVMSYDWHIGWVPAFPGYLPTCVGCGVYGLFSTVARWGRGVKTPFGCWVG